MIKSHSFIAIPPGESIKEQLVYRCLTQKEFAVRMDLSEKHISKLINGAVQLTPEVAVRLEMVLGIPAKFWNNLEASYREKLIKVKNENEMDADIEIAQKVPYREMAKLGWLPETRDAKERVLHLRKYFEVVQLGLTNHSQLNKITCRKLSATEKSDLAMIAWAQKAKIESRKMITSSIDLKGLFNIQPEIRKMTETEPTEFCPKLVKMLSECGIALVFLPQISDLYMHGTTFADGSKIVVSLSVRNNSADIFWFSLFHELAHIHLGHISHPDGTSIEAEAAADLYARDTLIPYDAFSAFVASKSFSKASVLSFAHSVSINPGIVVGRLQEEGYIQLNKLNELKPLYHISA
jgi:HTH-type transcriptional regulator/antitoxin HigA